jgi:hypothetical protein
MVLVAATLGGCLFATAGGCLGTWQRELDVLIAPEANTEYWRDSWLMNHNLGRKFIELWNSD